MSALMRKERVRKEINIKADNLSMNIGRFDPEFKASKNPKGYAYNRQ